MVLEPPNGLESTHSSVLSLCHNDDLCDEATTLVEVEVATTIEDIEVVHLDKISNIVASSFMDLSYPILFSRLRSSRDFN